MRKAIQHGLGQLQPRGTREGEIREAETRKRPNGETKAQEEPGMEKVGRRERATQEMGRGPWRGAVQKGPHGQGWERKKKQRTREGKQRGSGSQSPLTPAFLNFRVALATASKGQG